MSDGFSGDLDIAPVVNAFKRLVDATEQMTTRACRETAQALVPEMRSRLRRQLGPNATGKTEAAIGAEPAYDGNGWVIFVERDPFPAVPLWLEKGTRVGRRRNYARTAARPFFYASIVLAVGPHARRMLEALRDAGESSGLGT